jgi:hypothetical protein
VYTLPGERQVKVGSKTHYCDGTRRLSGGEVFGRLLNLYVRRSKRWVKVGTVCSNCGMHWINGHAYTVPR